VWSFSGSTSTVLPPTTDKATNGVVIIIVIDNYGIVFGIITPATNKVKERSQKLKERSKYRTEQK